MLVVALSQHGTAARQRPRPTPSAGRQRPSSSSEPVSDMAGRLDLPGRLRYADRPSHAGRQWQAAPFVAFTSRRRARFLAAWQHDTRRTTYNVTHGARHSAQHGEAGGSAGYKRATVAKAPRTAHAAYTAHLPYIIRRADGPLRPLGLQACVAGRTPRRAALGRAACPHASALRCMADGTRVACHARALRSDRVRRTARAEDSSLLLPRGLDARLLLLEQQLRLPQRIRDR
jgi:hypothetical protein